jgi:hypothetical protein
LNSSYYTDIITEDGFMLTSVLQSNDTGEEFFPYSTVNHAFRVFIFHTFLHSLLTLFISVLILFHHSALPQLRAVQPTRDHKLDRRGRASKVYFVRISHIIFLNNRKKYNHESQNQHNNTHKRPKVVLTLDNARTQTSCTYKTETSKLNQSVLRT